MKVDIFEYTILNNTQKTQNLLKEYGFKVPQKWNKMSDAQKLSILSTALYNASKQDEDFKMKLIALHPDLKLIEKFLIKRDAKKLIASADANTSATDTTENKSETPKFMPTKTSNMLMGAGVAILSIIIIKNII